MDPNTFNATMSPPTILPPGVDSLRTQQRSKIRYAGFWRRFFAYCLDAIAVGIVNKAIEAVISSLAGRLSDQSGSWLDISGLVVTVVAYIVFDWFYFAGLESSAWQATLGKRALGIVVTDLDGNRISFARATGRYFAHLVSVITFLIGYLIQPFTRRRQALHDLISRTLVAEKDSVELGFGVPSASVLNGDSQRRTGLPRWGIVSLVGVMVLALGCAALSFGVVLPLHSRYEKATRTQVADTISTSFNQLIRTSPPRSGKLVLRESDLDVNNAISSGEVGVDWSSNNGILIYGFETTINAENVTLGIDGSVLYRSIPVVANGLIKFTVVEDSEANVFMGLLLSKKSFEQGLEIGINRALAGARLTPTGVTLSNGALTILVVPR